MKNEKNLLNSFICFLLLSQITLAQEVIKGTNKLIYLNEYHLGKVKELIAKNDAFFTEAYGELIVEATKELDIVPNPVTNKTTIPPSGDVHDYMSIAVYRWPNPDTEDGMPWIVKDGQINPMVRTDDLDWTRLGKMFGSLNKLSMAYYFSEDIKYANKAKSIINTGFINENTKVNPNINFGQGIPGEFLGRRAGMIEWKNISTVVTTIQILDAKNIFNDDEMKVLNTWFYNYYQWAKTNKFGLENDNGLQNHSTCYDFQMVGIARYLGLNDEAKSRLEAAKMKRTDTQIGPDGAQPRELGRTRSVHYSSMNLKVMTSLAEMGVPLGVDLWSYISPDGKSIKNAFEFLRPYAQGDEKWPYKQIGGQKKQ
ncbi:Alginate lyase [Lutibacter agarilyticus]|uniref:Alginate lyase n=1 Tax=Lutibacter agarilyticus TaxID=1109740 RepID=A0A238Z1S1_9FLAO|nr:alginate lyase family protein [Lutibacter agarilyticus]SNR77212.1 Alginate lyase [Lutibacter agarilyticus]